MSSIAGRARSTGRTPGRTRRFVDPRLVIGLVLIVGSVVGVLAIVVSLDRTVTVFAADKTLVAGDIVRESDLVATQVRLGMSGEHYLSSHDIPKRGVVIVRTVGGGELVPRSAVADTARSDLTSIVVSVDGDLPKSVAAGSTADLWAATDDDPPSIVASDVTVVGVIERDAMMSGSRGVGVELLVPRGSLSQLLAAKASGDAFSLVPAAIALG